MKRDEGAAGDPGTDKTPHEYFSVRLLISDKVDVFTDPELAGAAFFRADPTERPSVAHIVGNTSRTMALTQIHGQHENGEHRYFKALPDSHPPDALFRKGFVDALENSLTERLKRMAEVKEPAHAASTDFRLIDDLEAFAYRSPETAARLWNEHGSERPTGPVLRAAVEACAIELASRASAGRATDDGPRVSQLPQNRNRGSQGLQIIQPSKQWER